MRIWLVVAKSAPHNSHSGRISQALTLHGVACVATCYVTCCSTQAVLHDVAVLVLGHRMAEALVSIWKSNRQEIALSRGITHSMQSASLPSS